MRMSKAKQKKNNQLRIERMENWIERAESVPKDVEYDYDRFLFYWIAYEAAYKQEEWDDSMYEHKKRCCFHNRIVECQYYKEEFICKLKSRKNEALRLLSLRQASRHFWKHSSYWPRSLNKWEEKFQDEIDKDCDNINSASYDGTNLVEALNSLFSNLNVVRNQIVHGGSSGKDSRGLSQVGWGTRLLEKIIPGFCDCIRENDTKNWGKPPFPRVGEKPDDKCPPPWMTGET